MKKKISQETSPLEGFFCYMVRCANGAFYTGWTTDPLRRIAEHNAGKGARYTRMNRPVHLVYVEAFADQSSAMRREIQIKNLSHDEKARLAAETALPDIFRTDSDLDTALLSGG